MAEQFQNEQREVLQQSGTGQALDSEPTSRTICSSTIQLAAIAAYCAVVLVRPESVWKTRVTFRTSMAAGSGCSAAASGFNGWWHIGEEPKWHRRDSTLFVAYPADVGAFEPAA